MAQAIGYLREDKATWGEKEVFSKLVTNLPKEYFVYAECPVIVDRKDVHPDFIILTNYGFIVLEVKDWKTIRKVDSYHAFVYVNQNEHKRFTNPVQTARDYAITLRNKFKLHKDKYNDRIDTQIPYGYAVVLPHVGLAQKSQIQGSWGEKQVFNLRDLEPNIIKKRLRETISQFHMKDLSKEQMDLARSVINPENVIKNVVLDEVQEKVVMEDFTNKLPESPPISRKSQKNLLSTEYGLFPDEKGETEDKIPEENAKIATSTVRLVRGLMGSGKTLVLQARARYLAKNNPDWKILVLTFNKNLAQSIKKELTSFKNIEIDNIHNLIASILKRKNKYEWRTILQQENWIKSKNDAFPIIKELGVDFVASEINWIQEVMISSKNQYLKVLRRGRGNTRQLSASQREKIYEVLEALNRFLENQRQFTWETLVLYFLEKLQKKEIEFPLYDAILIDEAQDFAPSWIAVVNQLLKDKGILFLTDDPTQSIFRFFTWRQKGVEVVGRTRWLKVPYRNTEEIFYAASAMVKNDPGLLERLRSEGELLEPDLSSSFMCHGEKPLLMRVNDLKQEIQFIEDKINYFRQKKNIPFDEMVLIHYKPSVLSNYKKLLSKYQINFVPCLQVKSLEYEVAFFCGLDYFFPDPSTNDQAIISHQKSLVYTSMGRPRNYLYMFHKNSLPEYFDVLDDYVVKIDA